MLGGNVKKDVIGPYFILNSGVSRCVHHYQSVSLLYFLGHIITARATKNAKNVIRDYFQSDLIVDLDNILGDGIYKCGAK